MSGFQEFTAATLNRLRKQAAQEGITPDALIQRLLSEAADSPPSEVRRFPFHEPDYQTFVDQLPMLIFGHLPGGEVTYINQAMSQMLGSPPEAVVGQNVFKLIPKEVGDPIQERLSKLTPDHPVVNGEHLSTFPRGTARWERWTDRAFFNEEGRLLGYLSVGEDITERKAAVEALESSQRQLTTLLDNLPGMIYRCDNKQDWTMQFVSSGCESLTGYAPEALVQNQQIAYVEIIHPDDRQHVWDTVQNALAQRRSYEVEYRIITADGALKHVWERGIGIVEDGEVAYLEGFVTDITQRKTAENALRESEQLYESLVNALPMNIYRIDLQGKVTFVNETFLENLGIAQGEIIGKTAYDVYPEDLAKKYRADDSLVLQQGETLRFTEINVSPTDGKRSYVEVLKTPVYDSQGNVCGIQGVFWDVTERKEIENALRSSEALYESLVGALPMGVYRQDAEGRLVFANQRMLQQFGLTLEEFQGKTQYDVFPKEQADQHRATDLRAIEAGKTLLFENTIVDPETGKISYREVYKTPLYDSEGNLYGLQGVYWDVTERKEMEIALRESSVKLQAIFDTTVDALLLADNEARYVDVNPAACELLGYSREELVGKTIWDVTPASRQQSGQEQWESFTEEGDLAGEYMLVRKDGSRIMVEFSAVYNILPGLHLSVMRDITERKRNAELALEMEGLRNRIQKEHEHNLLIQRIISMLSHDLRIPLTVIQSSRDLLHLYHESLKPERRQEILDTIGRQILYATSLLEDTVQMARGTISGTELNPAPTNLELLCKASIDEIKSIAEDHHILTFVNRAVSLDSVLIDEILLSRILLNLLSNAIKYSPNGGEIRLELDQQEEWIELRVVDHGMGIRAEDLPEIFKPFFRADDVLFMRGSGLGLSIVKECVKRHNGHIQVESVYGTGSIFIIQIPLRRQAAAS